MAKMTLLEMVQNIASAIEADEVNSISDTVDSYQIAREIQTAYFELLVRLKVPSKRGLILLDGLADTLHPNYLKLPDGVRQVDWFKYDWRTNGIVGEYTDVFYITPEDFVIRMVGNAGLQPALPYTTVSDFSNAQLTVLNTQNPQYWTTFDNKYLVTDGYNVALDTTLQNSKSLCWGEYDTAFTFSDGYYPDLDADLFPLLLAESKSSCFANIKQQPSPKDEQRANRQYVAASSSLWRFNQRKPYDRTPDFGRRTAYAWPFNSGTRGAH